MVCDDLRLQLHDDDDRAVRAGARRGAARPASMLYGRSATGGLVNAISKLPSEIRLHEIGVEYGSFDFKQVKLDITGQLTDDGKWLYRIVGPRPRRRYAGRFRRERPAHAGAVADLPSHQGYEHHGARQLPQRRQRLGAAVPAGRHGSLYPNKQGRIVPRNTFQGEPGDYYNTEAESVSLFVDQRLRLGSICTTSSRYAHTETAYDSHLPIVMTPLRYELSTSVAGILGRHPEWCQSPVPGARPDAGGASAQHAGDRYRGVEYGHQSDGALQHRRRSTIPCSAGSTTCAMRAICSRRRS